MVASEETTGQELARVPDFTTIEVILTYEGYDPMTFLIRRSLGHELRQHQRVFYGLSKEEQLTKQHEYRVDFLSKLIRSHPTGVPGYPVDLSVPDAFTSFFVTEEMEDMIDHIWVAYQSKLYPKELTLSTSE